MGGGTEIRITSAFKAQVLAIAKGMADGQIKTFNLETDQEYIEAVKIIIDWRQDIDNGFELTFSEDYTKLIRRNLRPIYGPCK